MKLTYYGHSCFAVETGAAILLFDPFIRANSLAASVDVSGIRADYILLSHGHFDHVSDAVELARQTGATMISNFEISTWLGAQGVDKAHPMNHGGSFQFPFGRVKFVNAIHSSVLPDGTYGGNPGGFVVEAAEGAFYYAGDTALTLDMQLIAEEFDLAFAVLPIGDNFTMGANDAGRASKLLKCKQVVGVHYDTFPPIKIDHEEAKSTLARHGATLHLPRIGESISL